VLDSEASEAPPFHFARTDSEHHVRLIFRPSRPAVYEASTRYLGWTCTGMIKKWSLLMAIVAGVDSGPLSVSCFAGR